MNQESRTATKSTKRVGFLLIDGFTMLAFSNVVEPLRMANYVSDQALYSWIVTGLSGDKTSSSSGIQLSHTALPKHLLTCDLVFICGGFETYHLELTALTVLIQQLAVRDIALGGLCTGALALAKAGLLDHQLASLHWENISAAQENYPNVEFHNQIFTLSPRLYSCSGGVCALDMTLHIIRKHFGRPLTDSIQDMFVISTVREPSYTQHLPRPTTLRTSYTHVIDAIALMKTNIEEPLSIADIANHVGLSGRQLQRLFKAQFDRSPQQYYLGLRLEHAQYLLRHTSIPINQIVIASGFLSASSFSTAFKKAYQMSPSTYRKQQDTHED